MTNGFRTFSMETNLCPTGVPKAPGLMAPRISPPCSTNLGFPVDHGRGKVREALKEAEIGVRDVVLNAAIRYRRNQREQVREHVEFALPERHSEKVAQNAQ